MKEFKLKDVRWSWNGDLLISGSGDIDDTSSSELLSFIQEVKTRIQSNIYDWQLQPHIGSNLGDLVGKPNNKKTAEDGKIFLISALTRDNFLDKNLIKITYLPVNQTTLMYRISIILPELDKIQTIEISLTIGLDEFQISFLNNKDATLYE